MVLERLASPVITPQGSLPISTIRLNQNVRLVLERLVGFLTKCYVLCLKNVQLEVFSSWRKSFCTVKALTTKYGVSSTYTYQYYVLKAM